MDKDIKKAIGKGIQKLRERSGLSQEDVAEHIGLTPTAISMIERGQNTPTLLNFVKIANTIKASTDEMLYDVLEESYIVKASILSDKLEKLSPADRNEIFSVLETMISNKTK